MATMFQSEYKVHVPRRSQHGNNNYTHATSMRSSWISFLFLILKSKYFQTDAYYFRKDVHLSQQNTKLQSTFLYFKYSIVKVSFSNFLLQFHSRILSPLLIIVGWLFIIRVSSRKQCPFWNNNIQMHFEKFSSFVALVHTLSYFSIELPVLFEHLS